MIGNPGATLTDDAASSWDDHPLAAEESANGDPKAKARTHCVSMAWLCMVILVEHAG